MTSNLHERSTIPTPRNDTKTVTFTCARDERSHLSSSRWCRGPGRGRLRTAAAMTMISLTAMVAATVVVAAPVSLALASSTAPASSTPASTKLVWIPRAGYRIAAYVQPGRGPAIVLCHGFPDNHHLYDSVVPLLRGREVVTFDFLGWGRSSKPAHYSYTFAGQEQDLNAVIQDLHLGPVVLVAHDASVPAVLNWTLDHPGRVASIVLSNGFYAPVAGSGPPTLAGIFALGQWPITASLGPLPPGTAYGLNSLMNGLSNDPRLLDDLLTWQESTFIANRSTARKFIPLFTRQFLAKPSTLGPLRSFAGNLFSAVTNDAARVPSLTSLDAPVHIAWGARDANLNLSVADALHQEIPHSTLTVLPNAHHNLMLDDPTQFAAIVRSAGSR
jgi:haloalkane dehalogenase